MKRTVLIELEKEKEPIRKKITFTGTIILIH